MAMLWRFLVKIIKMVVSGLRIASTAPKEAVDEDKFVQQPPKSKSPYIRTLMRTVLIEGAATNFITKF